MKTLVLTTALLCALTLGACANTFEGVQKDAERAGDKAQAISQIIIAP